MKLLEVVTTPSIYHGYSTRKTFLEEKFTGKENLFLAVNMKNSGCRNVRKHKEINGSDIYVTLDISSKFDSPEDMKITSPESKGKLEISGKGLITSLGFNKKTGPKKYKKERYAIGNFSKKELSKIIKEFEKIEKPPYKKKRTKHEPTDSYFHLARHLAKCMMISDKLNCNDHGGYTEMAAPSLNVNVTDEDKSKRIIVHKSLSKNCSTGVSKSKRNIVNKNVSQKNPPEVSEYTITELKDKDYKESSVTKEVKSYFNILECGVFF